MATTLQKLALLLIWVPSICAAAPAQEQIQEFMTGNDLYDLCMTSRPICTGYIEGASDEMSAFLKVNQTNRLCLPTGATAEQLTDVVLKRLISQPEERHTPAGGIVLLALIQAFPCAIK